MEQPQSTTGEHGDWAATNKQEKDTLGTVQQLYALRHDLEENLLNPDGLRDERTPIIQGIDLLADKMTALANFDKSHTEGDTIHLRKEIEQLVNQLNTSIRHLAEQERLMRH